MMRRKERNEINVPLLDRISREHQAFQLRKQRQAQATYNRIMSDKALSAAQKKVRLRGAQMELIRDVMVENEQFYLTSMSMQYHISAEDMVEYRRNKRFAYEKSDNRIYNNRQRRAKSDKYKNWYIHYIYADDVFDAEGELIRRGEIIAKYEARSTEIMTQELMNGTAAAVNSKTTDGQKAAAFRDVVFHASDMAMNSNTALFSKTMDDLLGEKAEGTPTMQHVAHSGACVFCKSFDHFGYRVSSQSKRPHNGCKCMRVPLAHYDMLYQDQAWRDEFEDMEDAVWEKAREEGEILSYSEMMSRLRTSNRKAGGSS